MSLHGMWATLLFNVTISNLYSAKLEVIPPIKNDKRKNVLRRKCCTMLLGVGCGNQLDGEF
jgi:hypothetical protein